VVDMPRTRFNDLTKEYQKVVSKMTQRQKTGGAGGGAGMTCSLDVRVAAGFVVIRLPWWLRLLQTSASLS